MRGVLQKKSPNKNHNVYYFVKTLTIDKVDKPV